MIEIPEIRLIEKRLEFCMRQARIQNDRRYGKSTPGNNLNVGYREALRLNYLGFLGEAALMLYLNPVKPDLKWHLPEIDRVPGGPDFESYIDAKSVDQNTYRLIIKPDDPAEWAYVLCLCEHTPLIYLRGWLWGDEGKAGRTQDPVGGRSAYFIEQAVLRPMHELRRMVEENW